MEGSPVASDDGGNAGGITAWERTKVLDNCGGGG